MEQGKIFEKLIQIARNEDIKVSFVPFQASKGRLHGDRIGLYNNMSIEEINYTLAHELSHHFLHYDKGNTIESSRHGELRNRQTEQQGCFCLSLHYSR